MATADVLRSQDCLRQQHPHRETRGNANYFSKSHANAAYSLRSRRRKRSPTGLATINSRDESGNRDPDRKDPAFSAKNIVMGQVKILKRGEPLPDMSKQLVGRAKPADRHDEEMILSSTGRLGPDPDLVQKQIRASDFYAGLGPIVPPHPSSLPFPALLAKKVKKSDAATMVLLRMLKLDLS